MAIQAVAGALSGIGIGGVIAQPAQGPLRHLQVLYNKANPTQYPTLDALLFAYGRGCINKWLLNEIARWNGVNIMSNAEGLHTEAWKGLVDASYPAISDDLAWTLYNNRQLSRDEWNKNVNKQYGYYSGLSDIVISRMFSPTVDDAIAGWFTGNYSEEKRDLLLKRFGLLPGSTLDEYLAISNPIGTNQVLAYYNANQITRTGAQSLLSASGIRADNMQKLLLRTSELQTPSLGSLVQYASNGSTDQAYATKWGLYADIPSWYLDWSGYAGAGRPNFALDVPGTNNGLVSWGQVAWASSRRRFSETELRQLYIRLRPGRESRFQSVGIGLQPFTGGDLLNSLQANGYTQEQVKYAAALSYRVFSIRELRVAIQQKTISDNDALEYLMDMGYLPQDAKIKLATIKAQYDKQENSWIDRMVENTGKQAAEYIIEGYEHGLITNDQANLQLQQLGFLPSDAAKVLLVADAKFAHETVKESIDHVEQSFHSGAMAPGEVLQALQSIGMRPDKAANYLARWNVRRNLPRRTVSVNQVVQWYVHGMLTYDQAAARLTNLGLTNPDNVMMLAQAAQRVDDLAARKLQSEQRTKAQQAKDLLKLSQAHAAQAHNLQAEAKRLTPVATLKSWLKKGLIDEDFFVERMGQLGFPQDVILKYMEEVESAKQPKPKPSAGATAPTTNGTGTAPTAGLP